MPSKISPTPDLPPKDGGKHQRSKTSPPDFLAPPELPAKERKISTASSSTTTASEMISPPPLPKSAQSKQALKLTTAPVQVCVRLRPITATEALKKDHDIAIEALKSSQTIRVVNEAKDKSTPRTFAFDAVFPADDHQNVLYDTMVSALITRCLEGYNGCIFAYGQTASGKTYTMQGPSHPSEDQFGVIQRVSIQIIKHMESFKKNPNIDVSVNVSYLEIYNEKLVDLLAGEGTQVDLKIRQEKDGSGMYVQGITDRGVSNLGEIMNVHEFGSKNRTVGETNMNNVSSRSHAVLSITVVEKRQDLTTGAIAKKSSKIHIVDLAGSERADSTGATGARLKEGAAINQSLSALGNVINSLTKPATDRGHIPYRDSKLTYLLSDSLGGNSLTLMIACLSPTLANKEETLSTLRFAERVKTIKNHAKINMDPLMLRILELESEVAGLKRKLATCVCGAGDDDMAGCSVLQRKTTRMLRSIKLMMVPRKRVEVINDIDKFGADEDPKKKDVIATREIS